jgi:hypothetical protein
MSINLPFGDVIFESLLSLLTREEGPIKLIN